MNIMRMRNASGGGAGGGYVEIGNLGLTTNSGGASANPGVDLKYGSPTIIVPAGGVWVKKVYFYLINGVAGVKMLPSLYKGSGASSDTLTKQGQEYTVPSTFSSTQTLIGPINWNADGSAMFLADNGSGGSQTYILAVMFDNSGCTLSDADGASGNLKRAADTYADGAAATYGTISAFNASLRAYIPYSLGGP